MRENRKQLHSRAKLFTAIIGLIFLFAGASQKLCAQTPNSTPTAQTEATEAERKLQLVQALERAQTEVRASRSYIGGLEASLKSKQLIIDVQTKRQTLSDEAIVSLQKEVEILKAAIGSQNQTIDIQKSEIGYLKKELDKTNKKLGRARKLNQFLIGGAAAAILALILK